jgi:hypothetical protein
VPAKTVATTQHRPATVATTMAKQPHTMQVTKAEVPKIPKAVMQHVHLGKGTVICTGIDRVSCFILSSVIVIYLLYNVEVCVYTYIHSPGFLTEDVG